MLYGIEGMSAIGKLSHRNQIKTRFFAHLTRQPIGEQFACLYPSTGQKPVRIGVLRAILVHQQYLVTPPNQRRSNDMRLERELFNRVIRDT
jgi:hypothetical protein